MIIQHRFVEQIPRELEDGILYISMEFGSAMHKCICGCGYVVVTPFSPTDWRLIYNGETVSLEPSIGNWSSECKSHYFITNNKVRMSRLFNEKEIKEVRKIDRQNKKKKKKERRKKR
jgi:hypothetical protein